jgi:hypothetical protein
LPRKEEQELTNEIASAKKHLHVKGNKNQNEETTHRMEETSLPAIHQIKHSFQNLQRAPKT